MVVVELERVGQQEATLYLALLHQQAVDMAA
jgi:hypothetical protein